MWATVKAYLLARWAEPETRGAIVTGIGVTLAALLGHWGLIRPATISLHTMYTTDVFSAVLALVPGPLSHLILQYLDAPTPPAPPPAA